MNVIRLGWKVRYVEVREEDLSSKVKYAEKVYDEGAIGIGRLDIRVDR